MSQALCKFSHHPQSEADSNLTLTLYKSSTDWLNEQMHMSSGWHGRQNVWFWWPRQWEVTLTWKIRHGHGSVDTLFQVVLEVPGTADWATGWSIGLILTGTDLRPATSCKWVLSDRCRPWDYLVVQLDCFRTHCSVQCKQFMATCHCLSNLVAPNIMSCDLCEFEFARLRKSCLNSSQEVRVSPAE